MRRYGWLVFLLVAFLVLGYLALARWQAARAERLGVETLLDDLRRETARLRAFADKPQADDLQTIPDFVERSRQVLPRAPAEARQQLNAALKEYLEAVRSVREGVKAAPAKRGQ